MIDLSSASRAPIDFIRENTRLNPVPLVPEIKLYLADEVVPLWQMTEAELDASGLPPPFWAFAWAGGQALARYILDDRQIVEGRRVLDFAAGSGLVGLAAALAGAEHVLCVDIDPLAAAACQLNATANGQEIDVTCDDLVGQPSRWDVVLAGDICYERAPADAMIAWLRAAAEAGADVLIGDPGRTYLPKTGLEKLVSYAVKTTRELEDTDVRNTSVWQMVRQCSA